MSEVGEINNVEKDTGQTVTERVRIPSGVRSEVLIANRHLCCVCQDGFLQIHHMNGDPSDNAPDNLAVLCMKHHEMATAPRGMTARLTQNEVRQYKRDHEAACAIRAHKTARGRTAFFMVDYKNVERIYQLYAQISDSERRRAVTVLAEEFQEEAVLRKEQGYSGSIEPNTNWNPTTQSLLGLIEAGVVHPSPFQQVEGHPKDPNLPRRMPAKAHHDIWVQILVRAMLTARPAIPVEDLMKLEEPDQAALEGRLVTLSGKVKGKYFNCDDYTQHPIAKTALFLRSPEAVWRAVLHLKTHYVYSSTAAQALTSGRTQGLVLFRGVKQMKYRGTQRVVDFDCTPLILGCGGGEELRVP